MKLTRTAALVAATALATAGTTLPTIAGASPPTPTAVSDDELPQGSETALVRLQLPTQGMLDELVTEGVDIAARPAASPEARGEEVLVDLVVTGAELAELRSEGASVLQVIQDQDDGMERFEASQRAVDQRRAADLTEMRTTDGETAAVDTLAFVQSGWWTSGGQTFVQAQVATTAVQNPDVEITVEWETADGQTGSFELFRYADAGEYLYHFSQPEPLPGEPVSLTATSSLGGTKSTAPQPWPGVTPPETPEGYQSDFIDEYMTPGQISERMDRLARQYPDLVDLVDLPEQTNGYRRYASGFLGDPDGVYVLVESVAYGSEGGNGVELQTVDPGAADQPLTAGEEDGVLTISLATGPDGAVTSTTDEVAALVGEEFAAEVTAYVTEDSEGELMPVGATSLQDGLDATHLNGDPVTVQALSIGKHRDGSRPGVLAYSQEHAREWATPLVTMEFAERMLANAKTDPETAQLLEDVEVFVLPVVNPDGANYSFYDYNFQRKNMTNHCTDAIGRDPRGADFWGVDINRNYAVGSLFDGYVGASTNCLSAVFAGTGELSEPEAGNVIALAEDNPNITHAINVHSYGGYFMWSPGAYSNPGRIPLPEPDPETAASFLEAAQRIVSTISGHRGTVTWPSKTGPVIDVLYSAAGNSADQLYYDFDIIAWDFEVGNDLWNEETQQWEAVGFQPPFEEAHGESQEYAAGLVELARIARDEAAADEPVERLSGDDRYGTAVEIGQEAFPVGDTAVLVSGEQTNLVDGLVAAPLGRDLNAPVLLTEQDDVPDVVTDDLRARGVTDVLLVGGAQAIDSDVVQELEAMDLSVERVSGADRYGTAAAVAELVGGAKAVVSSGESAHLVDALAVSGPAARLGTPILLVSDEGVPAATNRALDRVTSTVVVGGDSSIPDDVVAELPDATRVAGTDRWLTATAVADHYAAQGVAAEQVAVASGADTNMVDALPGGTLGQVILLSRADALPGATTQWLQDSDQTRRVQVLGGTMAVTDDVLTELEDILTDR